jgi:hypothetical protein
MIEKLICLHSPVDFLKLTYDLFGATVLNDTHVIGEHIDEFSSVRPTRKGIENGTVTINTEGTITNFFHPEKLDLDMNAGPHSINHYLSPKIWRVPLIPFIVNNTNLHKNVLEQAKKASQQSLIDSGKISDAEKSLAA